MPKIGQSENSINATTPDIAEKAKLWIALSEEKTIHQERAELMARLKNQGQSHVERLETERGSAQQKTEGFVNRLIDRLPKDGGRQQ